MNEPTPHRSGSTGAAPADDDDMPPVSLVPWGDDAWALVVRAGSDTADLFQALAQVPAGLAFSEAFGDVDVVLVYRLREDTPTRRACARAALRTMIDSVVRDDDVAPRWMTTGEHRAYRAGKLQAYDTLRWIVGDTVKLPPRPTRYRVTT